MALRTQGSAARRSLVALALGVVLASSSVPKAQAQDSAGPKLSSLCDAPFDDIAVPVALPRLSEALAGHKAIRVMAIGSSSTVGIGATSPSRNYPNQLSAILLQNFKGLDLTVVNRGVSGEVAAQTAERLKLQVAMDRPTLVLWQVGTNDALARVPADDFKATVRDKIRWLKSHDIDVVLVGLQYTSKALKDEHYQSIRAALRQLAEEEQVLLVRRFAAMQHLEKVRGTPVLTGDDLHLNDTGYRCMAEHVARAMVISSFLKGKKHRPPLTQ